MPDVTRQISVRSAAQGGYSTRAVPGPVSYQGPPLPQVIFVPEGDGSSWPISIYGDAVSGSTALLTGASLNFSVVSPPYAGASFLAVPQSRPPTPGDTLSSGATITAVDPRVGGVGGGSFTLEFYARLRAESGGALGSTSVRASAKIFGAADSFELTVQSGGNDLYLNETVEFNAFFTSLGDEFPGAWNENLVWESLGLIDTHWHHYALVVSNGSLALYRDGSVLTPSYGGFVSSLPFWQAVPWDAIDTFQIFTDTQSDDDGFNTGADIHLMRFTRGALYTRSFTPPTFEP